MPDAIVSEMTIIYLMLVYPKETIGKVMEKLNEEDFVDAKNREIFAAIRDLYLIENKEIIDVGMLKDKLEKRGTFEKIGGYDYLYQIIEKFYSEASTIDYHINILIEKSIYRKVIETSKTIIREAEKQERKANELLDFAEARILEIRDRGIRKGFTNLLEIIEEHKNEIIEKANKRSSVIGLPSGISFLDNLTGGFLPGNLIIIASRPSVGKTSFALFIHRYLSVEKNEATAIFSLEMSANELAQRFISMQSNVSNMKIRTGSINLEEFAKIIEAIGKLKESAPLWIDDSSSSLLEIKAKARRVVRENKVKLITIDYLQLIELEPHERKRRESRQQEIAFITRNLKNFAKELNIPIIVLSQLSRKAEERADKKPQLSDLRESGSIEQDADIVVLLYRTKDDSQRIIGVNVAKNRNGPIGEDTLIFESSVFRFTTMMQDDLETPSLEDIPFE
ncbi:MAG: replicative DNA helicase [candidate division WOR-3 bacterium]|nr:replicative DNA helicase [candidate division WOR-3 bacterium]